jgi:hypothetical protein
MVKKYLVETVSMFRMRYVVEAEEIDHAADEVCMEAAEEFGQRHIAENIVGIREVSDDEIPTLFLEDHPYLEDYMPERAFDRVTKIRA